MSAQTANVLRHVGKRAGVSGDIRAGAIHRNPGHHGTFDRTLIFNGRTLIGERAPSLHPLRAARSSGLRPSQYSPAVLKVGASKNHTTIKNATIQVAVRHLLSIDLGFV